MNNIQEVILSILEQETQNELTDGFEVNYAARTVGLTAEWVSEELGETITEEELDTAMSMF